MATNKYWEPELAYLESLVERTVLKREIKWGIPVYTYSGAHIVGVSGFKSYFGLWFYKGALLKDSQNLMVNAQEGKTQAMRQMRFTALKEVDEAIVMSYLEEAIENEKKGLQVVFEKTEYYSPQLDLALEADEALSEAFSMLTPYKQKEYKEYITSAKQESTKLARIEKIKPIILAGKGLHDKYK